MVDDKFNLTFVLYQNIIVLMSQTYRYMDEIKYSFNPFNEAQLKQAVGRLAFFFASDMGWVHKSISSKRDLTEEKNTGEVKDNE